MAFVFKYVCDKFAGKEKKISESAAFIGKIFDDDNDEQAFFDSVLACFMNFDEFNRAYENETFLNDIDFVSESTLTNLKLHKNSSKIGNRIDSYFYIYRRIAEYVTIAKQSPYSSWKKHADSNLQELRETLLERMTRTFIDTKGLEPKLCINDKDSLGRMNIREHLMSITEIDKMETLRTFFVLCKLSFQSSKLLDNQDHIRWIDILSKVQIRKLHLTEFMSMYMSCAQAFEQFPLDISAFIHLIGKMHLPKTNKDSPFQVYMSSLKSLNLEYTIFFDHFQPIFSIGVKDARYEFKHMYSFLVYLVQREHLFHKYFTIYAENTNNNDLWDMFLSLSVIIDLNGINQKQFSSNVAKRLSTAAVDVFLRYIQLALQRSMKVKDSSRLHFMKLLETIFDAFIEKQLRDDQYSYKILESELKDLLKICLRVSSIPILEQPSCLLIIQHLLFKRHTHGSNITERLNRLFQNLNEFDKNLCESNDPVPIIKDEWLKDYVLSIPQAWQQLTKTTYEKLCDNHQNNRWTIYIWSRIVNLALGKANYDNPSEILINMNKWMNDIKHNVYKADDALTIIFVISVFETIIVKYTKSVLLLPNIESIIEFIFHARQVELYSINKNHVDDFIHKGEQAIQDILVLKGKSNHNK